MIVTEGPLSGATHAIFRARVGTEEVMNRGLTQGYKVCLIFRRLPVWPPC